MVGELFSSDVRGFAGSVTGTLNWGLAFIVTAAYPPLTKLIGVSACYFIFTAISVETKGKSLPEIQQMLGEK
jgi:uncharacterized membrane protein required for colicin V production